MIRRLLLLSLNTIVPIVFFIGCGGGGGSGANAAPAISSTTGTGYYIDSAVSGIHYACGDQNGTTGADGSFKFEKGKDCTLSIGDITLRTVAAADLEDQIQILERNVSIAQLLQTLDADGNATNGLVILPSTIDAMKTAGIAKAPSSDTEATALYDAIKNSTGYHGKSKTRLEAQQHLDEMVDTSLAPASFAGKTIYGVGYYSDDSDVLMWESYFSNDGNETGVKLLDHNSSYIVEFSDYNQSDVNTTEVDESADFGYLVPTTYGYKAKLVFGSETIGGTTYPSHNTELRYYFDKDKAKAYFDSLVTAGGSVSLHSDNDYNPQVFSLGVGANISMGKDTMQFALYEFSGTEWGRKALFTTNYETKAALDAALPTDTPTEVSGFIQFAKQSGGSSLKSAKATITRNSNGTYNLYLYMSDTGQINIHFIK